MTRLFILILISTTMLLSQTFRRSATSGFVFLELPVTARTASMGETSIALTDAGAGSLFSNPAGTGMVPIGHRVSFSYAPWLVETRHYGFSYVASTEAGAFSVGAVAMDFGTMTRTVRTGGSREFVPAGTFTAGGTAFLAGYGRQLTDAFAFGVALKFVQERIDRYSASNVLFDGGILYHTGYRSLRLGATLQNFGTDGTYGEVPFRMPAILKLGVAAELMGDETSDVRITGTFEAQHPNDARERLNAGIECDWRRTVMVRYGHKFLYDEESSSVGMGIRTDIPFMTELDFSYSSYGRLGDVVRVTVQLAAP